MSQDSSSTMYVPQSTIDTLARIAQLDADTRSAWVDACAQYLHTGVNERLATNAAGKTICSDCNLGNDSSAR